MKRIDTFALRSVPGDELEEVQVFGTPVHMSADALVAQWGAGTPGDFYASEARHAVGSFLTVARAGDEATIVTSPGYCGGYFYENGGMVQVATTMAEALRGQVETLRADPFGMCFFLSYGPGSNFQQMPLSTMFSGLTHLPPGACLKLKAGQVVQFQSYLLEGRSLGKPPRLRDALEEMMKAYAAHARDTGLDTTLMFSGGADSLLLYLLAEQELGDGVIDPVVVDWQRNNGIPRAKAVSTHLDIPFRELAANDYSNADLVAHLGHCLSRDIILTRAPHTALVSGETSDRKRMVLHGQNMDAIALCNMEVLHANYERPFLSRAVWDGLKDCVAKFDQLNFALQNIQFTRPYIEDQRFQDYTAGYFSMIRKNTVPDPQPGRDGIMRGLISSQFPNLHEKATYPMTQMAGLDREVQKLRAFFGPEPLSGQDEMDMTRFYTYGHLANKRIATFPLAGGAEVLLPYMCGPLITYFLGKPRGLADAMRPKGEVFDLVEELTGLPYSVLSKSKKPVSAGQGPPAAKRSFGQRLVGRIKRDMRKLTRSAETAKRDGKNNLDQTKNRGVIIERYRDMIRPEASLALPTVRHEKVLAYLTKVYADVFAQSEAGSAAFKSSSESRALQVINLELILREASKRR